jgi:Ca2+-binding RTX toxin-like protein
VTAGGFGTSKGGAARIAIFVLCAVVASPACTSDGASAPSLGPLAEPPSATSPPPTVPSVESDVECTIVGTNDNDVLRGTPGDDVICGLFGDDAMVGLGGEDVIIGDRGNDRIDGGPGDDQVDGGRGADLVTARGGIDDVEGGPGRDAVSGDAGSDIVQAGRGPDFCVATEDGIQGNDVANGGSGLDTFDVDPLDLQVSVERSRNCSGRVS